MTKTIDWPADAVEREDGEARDVAALRSWLQRTAGARLPADSSVSQRIGALIRGARWGWQQFQWTRLGEAIAWLAEGLTMLALVVGAMAVLTTTLPGRFGYSAVVVTDGSMRPAVQTGDLVILRRRAAGSTVAVGDVVGVRSSGGNGLALRRVIAAQGVDGRLYLQTRADASAAADSDLRAPDQVAGVVVLTLPRLGWLLRATTTAPASYLLIWLPLALLTGQEAREFIREMRWGAAPVGGRFDPRAFDSNSEKLRLGADALRARLAGDSRRARARVRRAYPTRSSRRGAASTSEIASPSWNS